MRRIRRAGRVRPIDPFAGYFSKKLSDGMEELLLSKRVQQINFDFGSVIVHAIHYRQIAKMFVKKLGDKGIHTVVHPAHLVSEKSDAMYYSGHDTMYFESSRVLNDEDGRAIAIHEATHAVCDYRGRTTAVRSEEGACYLAEALYLLSKPKGAVTSADVPEPVFDIAADIRARATRISGPVALRASEINAIRREMARLGYENGYYNENKGIAGRRAA